MTPLEPENVSLDGIRLVEASAGTGKTYTIALLYLRLLLEHNLSPDEILVVTYTRAATAELKGRIRGRIEEAIKWLEGQPSGDTMLARVLAAHEPASSLHRLREALIRLDRASISTIHGFAHRVLRETAFETGQPFDFELLEDNRDIVAAAVTDYWIRIFYSMSEELAPLLRQRVSFPAMLQFARAVLQKPCALRVAHRLDDSMFEESVAAWHVAFANAAREFDPDLIGRILRTLNRGRYSDGRIDDWFRQLRSTSPDRVDAKMLELLSTSGLVTKKGQSVPRHAFFDEVERWRVAHDALQKSVDREVLRFRTELAQFVVDSVEGQLESRGLRSFDGLVLELFRACTETRGPELLRQLKKRYRAALIDEFQDTDSLQFEIFSKIFGETSLFLIGDPKQAIYGFRGADVHAYLKATKSVATQCYGLSVNYRSSPELLSGLEVIFSRNQNPFLLAGVKFHSVKPCEFERDEVRHDPLGNTAIKFLNHRSAGTTRVQDAAELALQSAVKTITQALNSEMTLKGDPVTPKDFAVLTRTNAFALDVQSALRARGVTAVFRGDQSVFSSATVSELERLMMSWLEPSARGLLRGALLTETCGVDADQLMTGGERLVVEHATKFFEIHRIWVERGILAAIRAFVTAYSVQARLLARSDGERRLTDLLHVAELLHRAEHEGRLGAGRIMEWLSNARLDPSSTGFGANSAQQMRLESDDLAVELFTVHTAKGLEFPFVVCPDLWASGVAPSPRPGPIHFHMDDQLLIDLSDQPVEEHLEAAICEWRAENQRLLYVALTRAKQRLYVSWGDWPRAMDSALGYLLGTTNLEAIQGEFISVHDALTLPDEPVDLNPSVSQAANVSIFDRRLRVTQRTTSYSSWVADANANRFAGRDFDAQSPSDGVALLLPSLPAGAETGQLVHACLEETDFQDPDPGVNRRVLEDFGRPESWNPEIEAMVRAVALAQLQQKDGSKATLSENRGGVPELEFMLTLRPRRNWKSILAEAFVADGGLMQDYAEMFVSLEIEQVEGYLRGFIDWAGELAGWAVVVDYKSNLLPSYQREAIRAVMIEHHYVLQAVVYAVALQKHLQAGRRELAFGGAHYLFLRGLDSDGRGVCSLHPSSALLHAFGVALGGGE